MAGNILKLLVTLIIGYFLGLFIGMISGAVLGAIPGLFFREIVNSDKTILMSIALSLISGVFIGFLATLLVNKFFSANDKPLTGALLGLVVGFIVVFFVDGVIDVSPSDAINYPFYLYPVVYSGIVGSDIGEIIFPIISAIRVIRSIIEDQKEAINNKKRLEEIKLSLGINSSKEEKRG